MDLGLVPVPVLAEEVVLHLEDVVVRVQAQCVVHRVLHEVVIRLRGLVVAIPLLVEADPDLPIAHLLWIQTVSAAKLREYKCMQVGTNSTRSESAWTA